MLVRVEAAHPPDMDIACWAVSDRDPNTKYRVIGGYSFRGIEMWRMLCRYALSCGIDYWVVQTINTKVDSLRLLFSHLLGKQ